MEKGDFLRKPEKLAEHAKAKHNTLDAGEINDFFTGDNLSPGQMDQIYSYLEGRSIDVVPVLDGAMPTEDTVLLGDADLGLDLDDDSFIKDVEEEKIDLNVMDLLEGIGIEDPVRMYFREIGTVFFPTADEELDLAQRKADGDEFAKERLVEADLHLVVSTVKRRTGRGMSFLDLVQESSLGLIKGAEKPDYTKGYKLSTYATWWIRQPVTGVLADQTRTIRASVHMVETIDRMSKMQRKLTLELSYESSVTELAEALNITEDKAMKIMRIIRGLTSLETPIDEKDDSNLGDFAADNNVVASGGNVESVILREHIDALLGGLKERERQVITLRSGLEDDHPRTLEEVSKEFNVTRKHIHQIGTKALGKLHNLVKSKRIRDSL